MSKKFKQASGFYSIIAASTLIGLSINFMNLDPIKASVYTAVINGVVSVPMLFVIMKLSNDKTILKDNTSNIWSNVIGWLTFVILGISVVIMFSSWGKQ